MANWVHVENNEIVGRYDLLPKSWRNVSGLDLAKDDLPFLKSLGWYPVTKQEEDFDSETHQINGYDYQLREDDALEIPIIVEKPPVDLVELKNQFMEVLRQERNLKLNETDWTQLVDVQNIFDEQTKNNWINYRQALRDLPQIYENNDVVDMNEVIWPSMEN